MGAGVLGSREFAVPRLNKPPDGAGPDDAGPRLPGNVGDVSAAFINSGGTLCVFSQPFSKGLSSA